MRRFMLFCAAAIAIIFGIWYLYIYKGVYLPLNPPELSAPLAITAGWEILVRDEDGAYAALEIRGVDLGSGMPGKFGTEYGLSKSDYLRWLGWIQDMGANTVRVYTVQNTAFYEAFYDYNLNSAQPLYLLHGLWLNDYTQFSHLDGYDGEFIDQLLADGKLTVDVIHGKRRLNLGNSAGSGSYNRDISPWTLGYILGVDWEDITVAYTDHMQADKNSYEGAYLYTSAEATPFEALLARLGDTVIEYETLRYGSQRLVAFANWPATDPFDYSKRVTEHFRKCAKIDVEHILSKDSFHSGLFASYHVYPYYPDYLRYEQVFSGETLDGEQGNTYAAYLRSLVAHHTLPVVISEFGLPSSRGKAQDSDSTGRDQGGLSEREQAEAIVDCYQDIKAAGCAGAIVFSWQDEWFKRTWNAMYAVDLLHTPYWSDYQTNEQYYGLLSFDPGETACICYVDGNDREWADIPLVSRQNGVSLKMCYDEKFLYFLVSAYDLTAADQIYLPLDITPKSGALYCENYGLTCDRPADFVLVLDGEESRVVVQERYCVLRAMGSDAYEIDNPYAEIPARDGSLFWPIDLLLQTPMKLEAEMAALAKNQAVDEDDLQELDRYETGLLTLGNANPQAADYNSLADYCYGRDCVEIKLPWQMLNFSDPSQMRIHDDYYANYGVEYLSIQEIYVGAARNVRPEQVISLQAFALQGWGGNVTWHERLKPAYYALQEIWAE